MGVYMRTDAARGDVSRSRGWRVVNASVRGTSHAKTGQPCQDSVYHVVEPSNGALIAAVADGAGSAELSQVGSQVAVRSSVEAARTSLLHTSARGVGEGYLRDVARASAFIARSRVESEARRRGRHARELATTLIFVVCVGGVLASAQIGDGAAVIRDESGEYRLLTIPQKGDYANETVFLVSKDALRSLRVTAELARLTHLAMFTDGIENIALNDPQNDPSPHIPFFAPLFRWAESQSDESRAAAILEKTLASPKFARRTDDDVTLLLASLSEAG